MAEIPATTPESATPFFNLGFISPLVEVSVAVTAAGLDIMASFIGYTLLLLKQPQT
jgi:hypothetical protein